MKRLYKNTLALLTGTSLFVIFGVVLVSSLSRYLLNSPIQWSEEVAKYAMIYGTMFGMALCYLEGLHIRFTFLEDMVSEKIRHYLHFVSDAIALISGSVITYSGYLFMIKRGAIQAPGTGIQMYYFQVAMVIGGVCLTIAALIRLAEYFQSTSLEKGQ
ncbi:TRAP transporter small permease [Marinomonas foliarum]|uniref:TRAP transporter small permease protein n=1 Tax=Marinomonas foliarum TaxID=491950 RepID=A0A369AF69_9GAMM|nr:TRAP transporter small permease [Marinomonas foliarum]QRV22832.1 TRAP transporter small permease [Marinomonas foliarum]RCX07008.1 TRAP-type C4-dicarboxylate transport system permease small subunit [Marinomonas foliarum]